MRMTLDDFEAKALQVLLSQRFLSLPLFEGEELSEYHISDIQGEMNLEDFIRQYAEVITEQFEFDYETRLKADMVTMLTEILTDFDNQIEPNSTRIDCESIIEQKIQALEGKIDGEK